MNLEILNPLQKIFNILPCIIKSRTNITRAHHVLEIHPDIVNLRNLLSDDLSFLRLGILQFLCLSLQRLKLQNKNIIYSVFHTIFIFHLYNGHLFVLFHCLIWYISRIYLSLDGS